MRSFLLPLCLLLLAVKSPCQPKDGDISGTISDSHMRLVVEATITARNVETGKRYQTESGDGGRYKVGGLPSGTYEISVAEFPGFVMRDVKVEEDRPVSLNIVLRPK